MVRRTSFYLMFRSSESEILCIHIHQLLRWLRMCPIPFLLTLISHFKKSPSPLNIGHFMSESDFFNYSHVGHAIQITRKWNSKPLKSFPSSYQPPMQVNIVTHSDAGVSNAGYHQVQQHGRIKNTVQQQQMPILPNWANFFVNKPWLRRYLPNGNPIYFIEKMYPFFLMDHIPSRYFEGLQRARIYYENEEMEQMTESLEVLKNN